MQQLCKKQKFIYNDNIYFVDVFKEYYNTHDQDYYIYHVNIYSRYITSILKRQKYTNVWYWKTFWLDYPRYHGDIDNIVENALSLHEKNLQEQKYISDKEKSYISE